MPGASVFEFRGVLVKLMVKLEKFKKTRIVATVHTFIFTPENENKILSFMNTLIDASLK